MHSRRYDAPMPAVFEDLQVRTWAGIGGLLNRYTILFPRSKEAKIRKTLTKRSFVFCNALHSPPFWVEPPCQKFCCGRHCCVVTIQHRSTCLCHVPER
jgi:hypothetical protein